MSNNKKGLETLGSCTSWVIAFVVSVILASVLLGLPVMLLWNVLLPQLFHFPVIDFWQALGLNVLCGCLFRGMSIPSKSK